MRIPEYISPTALMAWEKSPEEYYLQYLADRRPPRIPQTQPMAVGSAFDAYIKSYYHEALFGPSADPRFEFQTLFEEQVETQNRDWALVAGQYAFECYKYSGALADLLVELSAAPSAPRFEFTIRGEIEGVPLLGKPDLYYIHKTGKPIILDWKVNGFCAKTAKSPNRGYIRLRDGWKATALDPPSRNSNDMHKDCMPFKLGGVTINMAEFLESINKEWGLQLATYAWLMGAEVGGDFICALDQLACGPSTNGPNKPKIRVAEHRLLVGPEFQRGCVDRYKALWDVINSGHIFRDISAEESRARCEMLDIQYQAFEDGDDFMKEMTGRL